MTGTSTLLKARITKTRFFCHKEDWKMNQQPRLRWLLVPVQLLHRNTHFAAASGLTSH